MKAVSTHAVVVAAAVVVVALSGCGKSTGPNGAALVPGLPVAEVKCPEHAVNKGEPFDVDASASHAADGAKLVETHLKVAPGGDDVTTALTAQFTVDIPGPATISLSIKDDLGNVASAGCRVLIDDVDVTDPSDPGDPNDGADDPNDPNGGAEDPSDPADPSDPSDPSDPGDPNDPNDPTGPATGAPVNLNGAFAFVGYDAPTMSGGALDPATQCADAPALALVTIAQSGNHVDMNLEYCRLTAPNVNIFLLGTARTIIPDAIAESDYMPVAASFDLASATTGTTFAPPIAQIGQTSTAGTDLTDFNAPLPTNPDNNHVFDDDNDQNPGVTITGDFGDQWETYRRSIRAMSGVIQSSDVVDGSAVGSFQVSQQSAILADTNSFVPASTGRPSTFKLLRVDGGGDGTGTDLRGADGVVTCDDLRAHVSALQAQVRAPSAPTDCREF